MGALLEKSKERLVLLKTPEPLIAGRPRRSVGYCVKWRGVSWVSVEISRSPLKYVKQVVAGRGEWGFLAADPESSVVLPGFHLVGFPYSVDPLGSTAVLNTKREWLNTPGFYCRIARGRRSEHPSPRL